MTEPLAVQLYTVREQLAADREGTLLALASFGYRSVEAFDIVTDPEGLRAAADGAGLTVCSAHAHVLGEQAEAAFRGAGVVGTDTVIVPWLPPERFSDADAVGQVARDLNEAAKRAAGHGLRLGYHNHEFELNQLVGGRPALEVLVDQLDEDILLEIDTYWVAVGGQEVVPLLRRLGDRVTHLHIKDGPIDKDEPMTAVGAGRMPMDAIVAEAVSPPAQRMIVELDRCATDMLTAVRESHDWLEARR